VTLLLYLLAALLLLGLVVFLQPRFLLNVVARMNDRVLYFVETESRLVSLTIDDGPHAEVTPRILDVLREHDARATFFLIGERAREHSDLVERIRAEGHEIGNHLMRDFPSILLSRSRFREEVNTAHEILTDFGDLRWLRPASGWFRRSMLEEIEQAGYRCCLGSVYPRDTKLTSVGLLSRYLLWNVFPGSIMILHDGTDARMRTVEVLRRVLPELTRRGYRVVSVSDLVTHDEASTDLDMA
jgi:peptidoglycan/xylan/chitin deacetylase (PgdA/CDA1 family)